MTNPWNLTAGQAAAVAALVDTGCEKRAAEALGLSMKTVSAQIIKAKHRMGVATRLHAALAWDRYTRGDA